MADKKNLRLVVALFSWSSFVYGVCSDMNGLYKNQELKFFIYLTNWGLMLLNGLLAFEVYTDRYQCSKLSNIIEVWRDMTLSVSLVITLSFWFLLYDPVYHNQRFYSNLYEHAFNTFICLFDLLIIGGGAQVKSENFSRPLSLAMVYCGFTIAYTYMGGTDVLGQNYVYPILDWKKNCGQALTTALLTILSIPPLHFLVVYLQKKITSKDYSDKAE